MNKLNVLDRNSSKSSQHMIIIKCEKIAKKGWKCYDKIHKLNKFRLTQSAGWGDWIIHRLLLCGGVRSSPNEFPVYDIKPSEDEGPVMLELWGIRSTHSLPSLLGPLWLQMVALDRVLSIIQIEIKRVLMLPWIVWNRTVLIVKCV